MAEKPSTLFPTHAAPSYEVYFIKKNQCQEGKSPFRISPSPYSDFQLSAFTDRL
jgi:hypothetical protein